MEKLAPGLFLFSPGPVPPFLSLFLLFLFQLNSTRREIGRVPRERKTRLIAIRNPIESGPIGRRIQIARNIPSLDKF